LRIKAPKISGCIVKVIIRMERIPIIDKLAIENKAGCCAKIITPIPHIVVRADKIMEVL
jgi:hypothetical protein